MNDLLNIRDDFYKRITVFFKSHPYTRFNRLALMNAFDIQTAADLNRVLDRLISEGVVENSNGGNIYGLRNL